MASFRETSSSSPIGFTTSASPFTEATSTNGRQMADPKPAQDRKDFLPNGWRRLTTGLRGVRLYAVAPPLGGTRYWFAEVIRDGAQLSRRFASEIHARAWLIELVTPNRTASSFDWEELNKPFRAATMVRQ